jgi:hypothetical protein
VGRGTAVGSELLIGVSIYTNSASSINPHAFYSKPAALRLAVMGLPGIQMKTCRADSSVRWRDELPDL